MFHYFPMVGDGPQTYHLGVYISQISFIFTPKFGEDSNPFLTFAYVSDGLVNNHQLAMIWLQLFSDAELGG